MRCVGIDVSKDRLDVQVLPEGTAFAVARDGKGLADLIERLAPLAPDLVGVEATGGFETVVAAALAGAGLPLVVVNPAQVRHFAQALGQRAGELSREEAIASTQSLTRRYARRQNSWFRRYRDAHRLPSGAPDLAARAEVAAQLDDSAPR